MRFVTWAVPVGVLIAAGATSAATRDPVSLERLASSTRLRGGYLRAPEAASGPTARGSAARVVYLNRNGGAYRPVAGGAEDSSANRSIVLSLSGSAGGTLSPFPYGDGVWNDVVACMRREFAPYDVEITETDPGPTPHI